MGSLASPAGFEPPGVGARLRKASESWDPRPHHTARKGPQSARETTLVPHVVTRVTAAEVLKQLCLSTTNPEELAAIKLAITSLERDPS